MSKIVVEVIGVEHSCPKCRKALEIVNSVIRELGYEDKVRVVKLNANSPDVIVRYGIVLTPSIAVNGLIRVSGRIPSKDEVVNILKEATRSE